MSIAPRSSRPARRRVSQLARRGASGLVLRRHGPASDVPIRPSISLSKLGFLLELARLPRSRSTAAIDEGLHWPRLRRRDRAFSHRDLRLARTRVQRGGTKRGAPGRRGGPVPGFGDTPVRRVRHPPLGSIPGGALRSGSLSYTDRSGLTNSRLSVEPAELCIAVGEDPTVGGGSGSNRRCSGANPVLDDRPRLSSFVSARRAVEDRVTEGEHSPVRGEEVVIVATRSGGNAGPRACSGDAARRAVERGAARSWTPSVARRPTNTLLPAVRRRRHTHDPAGSA